MMTRVNKNYGCTNDCTLLFFILVFLLLFYDNSKLGILGANNYTNTKPGGNDCTLLFFILVFLMLFY